MLIPVLGRSKIRYIITVSVVILGGGFILLIQYLKINKYRHTRNKRELCINEKVSSANQELKLIQFCTIMIQSNKILLGQKQFGSIPQSTS